MDRHKVGVTLSILMVILVILGACAQPTPQVIEKPVTVVVQQEVPVEKIVRETVVVEKEVPVEKVVKETVVVEKEKVVKETVVVEKEVAVTPTATLWQLPVIKERPTLDPKTPKAKEQVLRVGDYAAPRWPNPFEATGGYGQESMMDMAFETLFDVYPGGELKGRLVDTWEVSADGTVWTLRLKAGIKACDGAPFTAEDVKGSLEAIASPKTAQMGTNYLRYIKGFSAMRDKGNPVDTLEGVTVVDDLTVRIELSAPFRDFGSVLAIPGRMPMVEMSNYPGPDNKESGWFIGHGATGPFYICEAVWTSPTEPEKFVLCRNPHWRGDTPYLERVEQKWYADFQTYLIGYENNEFDVSISLQPFEAADMTMPGRPYRDEVWPFMSTIQRCFLADHCKPPLDDVKVRQALVHAVDFRTIAEAVLRGMWYPLDNMIPPGFPGYDGENHWLEYNPEKARQLIKESKYGSVENLPEIRMVAPELGGTQSSQAHISAIALAIQQYWKKNLGLEVIVTGSGPEYQQNPDLYQIRRLATAARYAGLSAAICDNVNPSSTYMATYKGCIGDPASDEGCLKADILPLEEAIPLYQEMGHRYLQEAYMIGAFRQYDYLLIKPWVSNWGRKMGGLCFGVYDPEHIFIAQH